MGLNGKYDMDINQRYGSVQKRGMDQLGSFHTYMNMLLGGSSHLVNGL